MLNERMVYLNGEYLRWEEANIPIMSHSVGRGSAIFEVIGFHETKNGPVVFRLDEYISRFWKSASLLEMEPPLTRTQLQTAIEQTVKRSGLASGLIKLFGYYPEISFSILPPQKRFQVAVFVFTLEEALGCRQETEVRSVTACLSHWRRLDPESVPVEAKVAANYVNGMVARQESRARGFDYAIMLDNQGFIAEGGTESLFLVREGGLLTPTLGTILPSITRKSLLEVAEAMGIRTFTGRLTQGHLDEVDEIFFSATPAKLRPVSQVESRILREAPGPVTRRLSDKMKEILSGRDRQFKDWLFPVS